MPKHEVPIPKRLRIGAVVVNVAWGGEVDDDCVENQRYGHFGGSRRGRKRIALDSRQDDDHFSCTFIHEVLEAISSVWTGGDIPHSTLCTMSEGLHQAFEQMGVRFVKGDRKG